MFAHIISDLESGKLPDNNLLRKRFEAALIKKMGVIRTPCSFWPADTKINPPAKQLLWAAILLQDKENITIIEAIISTELEEKQRAKGHHETVEVITEKTNHLLQKYIQEFIELAPDDKSQKKLKDLTKVVESS